MQYRNDFKALYNEIEKLSKRGQHHIVDGGKFSKLKNEILDHLKMSLGQTSRAYKIVKLTQSPATVFKVMNHIAARTEVQTVSIAVNM